MSLGNTAGTLQYDRHMTAGPNESEARRAVAGEYLGPRNLKTFPAAEGSPRSLAPTTALTVEDYQQFIRPDEQKFYDWCIGLLEDSGVVGELKNERLYLDSALSGQLAVGGESYQFELSRSSVHFADEHRSHPLIRFSGASIETEGRDIEANQVGKAFDSIRQQAILNRIWASCTSLSSSPAVGISNFRLGEGRSLASMELETSLGECTVSVRRSVHADAFRYSVFHVAGSAELSSRVADAILADVAEDLGASPVPESILDAMIEVADRTRSDQEWLSVAAGLRARPLGMAQVRPR